MRSAMYEELERRERHTITENVRFGSGSSVVVPKSGVEGEAWNDTLSPSVAVPRLCGENNASRNLGR
jgi:hypothetical protein